MISLLHLSRLTVISFFLLVLSFNFSLAEDKPADIWEKKEEETKEKNENQEEGEITIKSPILSGDINKIVIQIDENKIIPSEETVIGIFDPEENNFNLNMWTETDGEEIKKTIKRIDKLKLSKLSENLLFKVLFTNAYPPKKNLSSDEFLDIKINWLIKKKRIRDLEIFLKNNPEVGHNAKGVKFLINEYLSSADIKSACNKVNFIDKKVENNYLEKFTVYCLIYQDRKEEAQLFFDLLKEKGLKDKFFEEKINFLLGITSSTSQKVLDNNLLNFYLSHVTSSDFKYEPNDKTNKYIWRYLSSANLIEIKDFENEEVLKTYEQAAQENSFDNQEIFKIYLKMSFNFNQLVNSEDIYKSLPTYKARALIYQSILLSDDAEKKINLAFLLKDLFDQDKLLNVYSEELSSILNSIDKEKIPDNYVELVNQNLSGIQKTKIKFDNDILHRSKVIKHFLEDNKKISKTEKDFKSVYKKIKRNKKYFVSIKDIVVLDALEADGVTLPTDLDYEELASQLTVPQNLNDLVKQNQIGLVMLKIVEIIGEDKISNLDPETVYFLNKILNQLNLKKIRNDILSEALPARV